MTSDEEAIRGKLEIRLGNVTFSGEGDQEWLSSQLERVIESAEALGRIGSRPADGRSKEDPASPAADSGQFTDSLASYLRASKADKSQLRRFLAAADWLRRRGESKLTTKAVAKALSDNHQPRLANPSDCLNKNVAKGFCEKKDGGFFITPEGQRELGYNA